MYQRIFQQNRKEQAIHFVQHKGFKSFVSYDKVPHSQQ